MNVLVYFHFCAFYSQNIMCVFCACYSTNNILGFVQLLKSLNCDNPAFR